MPWPDGHAVSDRMSHVSTLPPPPPPSAGPFGPPPPNFGLSPNPFAPSREIRPRGSWYFIVVAVGLALAIIGVVVIAMSAIGFADKIDDFRRVDVPGTATVVLDAGSYTVYAEGVGTANVTIRQQNEQMVELRPYSSDITYDMSDHHGHAVFSFRAPVTGSYFVSTTGPPGAIVAIGPGLGSGLIAGILGGIGLILGGMAFAIVGSIIVGVKRGRSRRSQFV